MTEKAFRSRQVDFLTANTAPLETLRLRHRSRITCLRNPLYEKNVLCFMCIRFYAGWTWSFGVHDLNYFCPISTI